MPSEGGGRQKVRYTPAVFTISCPFNEFLKSIHRRSPTEAILLRKTLSASCGVRPNLLAGGSRILGHIGWSPPTRAFQTAGEEPVASTIRGWPVKRPVCSNLLFFFDVASAVLFGPIVVPS